MKARCVSSVISTTWDASAWSEVGGIGGGSREWAFPARRSRRRRSPTAGASNLRARSALDHRLRRSQSVSSFIQPFRPYRSQASPPMSHSSIRASLALRRDSPSGCFESATAALSDFELPIRQPKSRSSSPSPALSGLRLHNVWSSSNNFTISGPLQITSQRPVHLKRPGTFSSRDTTNASSDWPRPQR